MALWHIVNFDLEYLQNVCFYRNLKSNEIVLAVAMTPEK
jgi:hypothetical protein